MKRLVPFILVTVAILITVLPSNLISANASGDILEKDEAVALIQTAVELRTNMGMGFQWYEGGASKDFFLDNIDTSDRIRPVNKPEQYPYHSFFKVKDGYDPVSVKQLITDTFTDKIAGSIIENSKTFFDLYYQENGIWFYGFYRSGNTFSFEDGDRPYTWFEPAEIDGLKILENAAGHAVVSVPVHRNYNQYFDGNPENARVNTEVIFYLGNSSGKWKIEGADFSNMIFRADKNVPSDGELTEAFVRESIIAAVCDLDSMIKLNAYNRLCTYGRGNELGQNKIYTYRENTTTGADGGTAVERTVYSDFSYNIFEGNLADIGVWKNYANNFCTEETTSHILDFGYTDRRVFINEGRYLTFMSGLDPEKLYFLYPEAVVTYDIMTVSAQYGLKNVPDDKITIKTTDDTHAEVIYEFRPFVVMGYEVKELDSLTTTIQYLKTENGWRINSTEFIDKLNETIISHARFELNNLNTVVENPVVSAPDTGDSAPVVFSCVTVLLLAAGLLICSLKSRAKGRNS